MMREEIKTFMLENVCNEKVVRISHCGYYDDPSCQKKCSYSLQRETRRVSNDERLQRNYGRSKKVL